MRLIKIFNIHLEAKQPKHIHSFFILTSPAWPPRPDCAGSAVNFRVSLLQTTHPPKTPTALSHSRAAYRLHHALPPALLYTY